MAKATGASGTPPENQSKESHMKQAVRIVNMGNQLSNFIPIKLYSSFKKLALQCQKWVF